MDIVANLLPFVLVFARLAAFLAACPQFIPDNVPMRLRMTACFALACALSLAVAPTAVPKSFAAPLLMEVAVGVYLGMYVRLIAQAVSFAGELFDIQFGFSFARVLNPMLGEETGPVMHLCQLLAGLIFFEVGGQHMVLRGLIASFVTMPPGQAHLFATMGENLITFFQQMLSAGLLLAIPIVITMLLVQVCLALISRMAQQLNVWSIGLLGTMSLGLLALWCNLPALVGGMSTLWQDEALAAFRSLR